MKSYRNLDELLNQTFFGLDTLSLLRDVEDFVNFSEQHIELQLSRELHDAERAFGRTEYKNSELLSEFHAQEIAGIEYHFRVILTQRVRYSALLSVVTTLEWVLLSIKKRAKFGVSDTPRKVSKIVHLLRVYDQMASLDIIKQINVIEALLQVRNCIVHAAGLVDSYRYKDNLRALLHYLTGIIISDINFLGTSIEIQDGCLQQLIQEMKHWLPSIEEVLSQQDQLYSFKFKS